MKSATPLLVSIAEAAFQLSVSEIDVIGLIYDGEMVAVSVRGKILVVYESLTAFTRRAKRNSAVRNVTKEIDVYRGPDCEE